MRERCNNCMMIEKLYFDAKANNDDQVKAIRTLQAEVERLQSEVDVMRQPRDKAEAEVERLRKALDRSHDIDCSRRPGSAMYCPACATLAPEVKP